jgi:hypothetical protein
VITLTSEEIQQAWDEIVTARRAVECGNIFVTIKHPTQKQRDFARTVSSSIERRLKSAGVITRDEAEKACEQRKIWTPEHETKAKALRDKILKCEKTAAASQLEEVKKRSAQQAYDDRLALMKLERGRWSVLSSSCENIADEFFFRILAVSCIEYADHPGKRIWYSVRDLMSDPRTNFTSHVISELRIFIHGFTIEVIRTLARNPTIYSRWQICQENGMRFFEQPTASLNTNQLNLCYWLRYYSQTMKAFGTPPDGVLEIDDHYDNWVKEKIAEMESGLSDNGKGKGIKKDTHVFSRRTR